MKKYTTSFFIYFLIFGVLVQLVSMSVNYLFDYINVKNDIKNWYKIERNVKNDILKELISKPQYSIDSILQSKAFKSYLNDPMKYKKSVQELFFYISNENRNYMQIRYIDLKGDEKIRVDRDFSDGKTTLIDSNLLQNKKDRYYFKDVMNGVKDDFWYSKIDLNVENGKVKIPRQHTLRVAKVVYKDSKKEGIVIINMLFDSYMKKLVYSNYFDISLVDGAGNYIFSSHNTKPMGENLIQDKKLNLKKLTDMKEDQLFILSISDIIKSKQNLFLVFDTKEKLVNNILKQNIKVSLIVLFIALIITVLLALIISKIPSKLHNELKDALKVIDKYVLMMTINKKGFIETISEAMSKRVVFAKNEIIGKKYTELLSSLDVSSKFKDSKSKPHGLFRKNLKCMNKDGKYLWLYQDVMPLMDDNGKLMNGYACFFTDITDKKEIEKKAVTDPLTNVSNRAKLDDNLNREVNLAKRYGRDFSVIMSDIDFFKKINDTHGHQVGDGVLMEFAEILVQNCRKVDIVGRYGGEEFLMILSDTSKEGALRLAQKIRLNVEKHLFLKKYRVTASFGVATFDKNTNNSIKTLIKSADEALYCAKKKGRNRVEVS